MSINERIRILRKQLGLTQRDFGAHIGLKHGTISWMEKDGNSIIDQNKRIICDKFHISMHWLETGEGNMYMDHTRTDELVLWAEKLSNDSGDSFPKRFATALSRLGDTEWSVLEKIVDDMAQPATATPSVTEPMSERERAHVLLDQEMDAVEQDASALHVGDRKKA